MARDWLSVFISILLPFLFGLPYVVQRRKKLWTGLIVHGILNGGGFFAVVAGLA